MGAAAVLVTQTRKIWFFGDEWAFLLTRDLDGASVLEPHNEHWSTVPLVIYRLLFAVLGLDHHLAYALLPIALHVLICVLLFVLLRRHGTGPWTATITTLLLAFLCGDLAENPVWGFQIGFLGTAALGLLMVLAHDVWGRQARGLLLVWALAVLALATAGMAVPMLVLLGSYVLLSRGLVPALLATVPPALVYLLWYLGYGRDATAQAPPATLDQVVLFSATGLARLWEDVLRLPGTGGVTLVVLLLVTLLARLDPRSRLLALSGLATAITTYVFLGVSRGGLGAEAATASRYAYFGVLLTLPAFAALLGLAHRRLAERATEQRVLYGVALLVLALSGAGQTIAFADGRATLTAGLEPRLVAAAQIARDGEPVLNSQLALPYHPDITVEALRRPDVQAALPNSPVTRQGLLDAAVVLQAASSERSLDLPAATAPVAVGTQGVLSPTGCSRLLAGAGAFLDLPPTRDGSQVSLAGRAPAYPVQMFSRSTVSIPVELLASPTGTTTVGSTSSRATLRINLSPGQVVVCLGGPPPA